MKKEDKAIVLDKISALLDEYPHFYLADIEGLNAEDTMRLRRECFKAGVKLVMVKNKLVKRVLHEKNEEFAQLDTVLKGNTVLMLCEQANAAAKVIKSLTKDAKDKKLAKPELKAAYAQEGFYIGAEHLETLVAIKSREELLAEVISLLESPIKNVVSSLQSSGSTIHGLLKTLEER
ncbi:50S ribosomal protein L10 [Falsiporphyromonas endometrii]|uniref:Large ribosomal subunit protein uL10 n=1 Tax=Falsiporphyromonas endometrii TaxID=1387297 RepID=A0ABV9K8H9_9PORP|nr:50S ribosomal protein L10 [Porphyromonadaceae bacterium]